MSTIRCTLHEKVRVEAAAANFPNAVETDIGAAYGGYGELMGATEVMAVALGNCILTMIALAASQAGVDLTGAVAEVTKKLVQDPQLRISELSVVVTAPAHVESSKRAAIEEAAKGCPVHRSLHPDIKAPITVVWE